MTDPYIHWLLIIVTVLASLLVMRMLVTTIHELGHAVVAYFFTKRKVTVFLGSYGNTGRSRRISIGKFEFWVFVNPLLWNGGLCQYDQSVSAQQNMLIILGGPLGSLLLFIVCLVSFVLMAPEGLAGGLLLVFCIWTGLSVLHNIVPRSNQINVHGGNITYNDGSKLKKILDAKKMPAEYSKAVTWLNEGKYAECVPVFDDIIAKGTKNPEVYRMAVGAYIGLKDYSKADKLQKEQVARLGNINELDRINIAMLKIFTGRYDEAEKYYLHLLQTGSGNKYNLNNYGYLLNLMKRYQDAILYLDKAIAIDKDFAYAWANRAFAKLMLGWLSDGKADNDRALEIDKTNGYIYRNEGIYLFEKGKYAEALAQFNKAKELEADVPLVDDYIWRATKLLDSD